MEEFLIQAKNSDDLSKAKLASQEKDAQDLADTLKGLKEGVEMLQTTKAAIQDDINALMKKKTEIREEISESESRYSSERNEKEAYMDTLRNNIAELEKRIEQNTKQLHEYTKTKKNKVEKEEDLEENGRIINPQNENVQLDDQRVCPDSQHSVDNFVGATQTNTTQQHDSTQRRRKISPLNINDLEDSSLDEGFEV